MSEKRELKKKIREMAAELENVYSERDAYHRSEQTQAREASAHRAARFKLEQEKRHREAEELKSKRTARLAELREGIVRLCCAEVTVSKKNDGESWVTVEFQVDAEELRAVEEFLEGEVEPKLDPVPEVGDFIRKCEELTRAVSTNYVRPLAYVAGRL